MLECKLSYGFMCVHYLFQAIKVLVENQLKKIATNDTKFEFSV